MCRKDRKCYSWISLRHIGLDIEGCIRDDRWVYDIKIPCSQSIINSPMYINTNKKTLQCVKTVAHGSFGLIDCGVLIENGIKKDVYIKRPIISGKSLFYEACIQHLVYQSLERIGFPTGAPKVVAIFTLKDNSVCFAMETIHNSITLSELLSNINKNEMTKIIVDCLFQVCAMVWHLENDLGINHRDLKPSNFLITEHPLEKKIIVIENEILEIESNYTVTFIDFGFSCLGSVKTHEADISLSSIYPKNDPCPKNGRDMYLFIAFLYTEFYDKMSEDLLKLFEKWLYIPKSNIVKFLRRYGMDAKEWIYFITGNPDINEFNCCPYKIVMDLSSL